MSQFAITQEEYDQPIMLEDSTAYLELSEGGFLLLEEPATVDSASDGLPPGLDFQGSRRCAQCGFLFKYEDLVFFRGRWYGKPCGDASDIQTILRREADGRLRKGEDEDVSHRKASYRGNYTTR